MRLADPHTTVRRVWTVELRPQEGGPRLLCPGCPDRALPLRVSSARSAALAHLACHARADALPVHLRVCQCRERGCCWHPRHRGCAGPVLLALTRSGSGRSWRLADVCAACAAATGSTAVVPETALRPALSPTRQQAPAHRSPAAGSDARLRVREMLTYLAAALPRFTSPAARLVALQCALRADTRGRVRLPVGLLRGMRLHGRPEPWRELTHTRWLQPAVPGSAGVELRLLDAAVRDQAPGRRARRRAAHWALRPLPVPSAAPPAVHLTALVLAAHSPSSGTPMEVLSRLSGHSPQQTAELLDLLVAARTIAAWRHDRTCDDVFWQQQDPALP
ncbi:hypothetical protein AB0O01_00325 [Streptomyces sp. NPDC093252]|uniref:hypothetical protein n=1 Tax=Streptomyces sp. NPDC093252 TaxID=3154980 RepID=UPI00341335B8